MFFRKANDESSPERLQFLDVDFLSIRKIRIRKRGAANDFLVKPLLLSYSGDSLNKESEKVPAEEELREAIPDSAS